MAISSLGVGSGIDLNSLVDGLLDAERIPQESRLDRREAEYQQKFSAFGQISSSLSSFSDVLDSMKDITAGRTASSSNSDLIDARASESAVVGNYSITVNQLAQSHSLASGSYANSTDVVGEGTLNFTIDGTTTAITIDSSNNTLEGVRNAINDADIGANAIIVNDGSGYRLLLSSENSGLANSMEIAVTGDSDASDTDNAGLSALSFTTGVQNMTETVAAQDSEFVVNGLTITNTSNTVSDALPGITLDLKAVTADAQTISINHDKENARSVIEGFVEAYNNTIKTLKGVSFYDAASERAGALQGDSLTRGLVSDMRNNLVADFGGTNTTITMFVSMGIKTGADGSLTIDETALNDALDNNYSELVSFAATAAEGFEQTLSSYQGPDGLIKNRQESLQGGLRDIDDDRLKLEDKLTRLELRLVKQYSALDSLLAGLQQTSTFISTQLASLDFSPRNNQS